MILRKSQTIPLGSWSYYWKCPQLIRKVLNFKEGINRILMSIFFSRIMVLRKSNCTYHWGHGTSTGNAPNSYESLVEYMNLGDGMF